MKFLILLLVWSAQVAMATTYLCISESPRGAIALQLDELGHSIGRQSNPFTRDYELLLTDQDDQYNKLNVGNVSKTADGYVFNASVYILSNNPEVLKLTKSTLKKNRLHLYIGDDRYMDMTCKKKNLSL